jgi:2-polyprenyl-3-methyl-5-hydroxy-6-metoxy-1,4-benzoquinol methylase
MTHFTKRLEQEKSVVREWLNRYNFNKVLDAGCGSGLYTILLNQLGVEATGIDISSKMIRLARENARRLDVPAAFLRSSFADLNNSVSDIFDAIMILGNSLVHILNPQELIRVLSVINERLRPDGYVIIQILNYDKIISEQKRIVAISRQENNQYIRFYDFGQPLLRFNSLHIQWDNGNSHHNLTTTEHYPYRKNELTGLLQSGGYQIRDLFGSMKFDVFNAQTSANCIIVAQKSDSK